MSQGAMGSEGLVVLDDSTVDYDFTTSWGFLGNQHEL